LKFTSRKIRHLVFKAGFCFLHLTIPSKLSRSWEMDSVQKMSNHWTSPPTMEAPFLLLPPEPQLQPHPVFAQAHCSNSEREKEKEKERKNEHNNKRESNPLSLC
jgi:hypothetical protein